MRRWMMLAGAAVTLALAAVTVPAFAEAPDPIVDDNGNLVVAPGNPTPGVTITYRPPPGTSQTPYVYKPRYLKWRPCPADRVDTGELVAAPFINGPLVTLSGSVEPCQDPASNSNYAVFGYSPGGAVQLLQHFTFHPHSVARNRFLGHGVLPDSVRAVCLVTYLDARVACLAVAGAGTEADPVRFSALPTDDPLVDITLTKADTRVPEEPPLSPDPCPACPRTDDP